MSLTLRRLRATLTALLTAGLMASGALAAPACVDMGGLGAVGGMGGTGKPLEERPELVQGVGVGGTGSPARGVGTGGTGSAIPSPELEAPGGIGGTGNTLPGGIGGTGQGVPGVSDLAGHPGAEVGVGGTGIVGTITGFASVCVNGGEVHYEDAVPVSTNGEPASVNALAAKVVVIDAHGSSRGLEARSIAVVHALDGPVTEIAGDRRSMKVMGQTVRFAGSGAVPAGLNAGDRVAVSGLRGAGGVVMASRIDRGRPDLPVSAVGLVGADHSLYGVPLMARYKAIDTSPRFLAVDLEKQLLPGSFEHAVHHLLDHAFDLSLFDTRYRNDQSGASAYPTGMLHKVILSAYAQGVVSSRGIERLCREHVSFIALSGDSAPHFTTLAAFVSSLDEEVAQRLAQVLYLCDRQGWIGREMFAIDGVKLPSNASKARSGTRADFAHQADTLEAAAKKMLERHRLLNAVSSIRE